MRRVYKYPTGTPVPEGAKYLNTVTQTKRFNNQTAFWERCWLVWHYFLVETDD